MNPLVGIIFIIIWTAMHVFLHLSNKQFAQKEREYNKKKEELIK